jgi:hypothetical protein
MSAFDARLTIVDAGVPWQGLEEEVALEDHTARISEVTGGIFEA